MSTFLPKETLPQKVPTGFAHILEYDFIYPFPEHTAIDRVRTTAKPMKLKKKKNKKPNFSKPILVFNDDGRPEYIWDDLERRAQRRRSKNVVSDEIEKIIALQGFNGTACVSRLACESIQYLSFGESLLEDLIIAFVPEQTPEECQDSYLHCPFSPLQFILHSQPANFGDW